jgi:hypothetical protein
MDHPRRVEPPPQNVQQCYAHVVVEKGDGAPSAGTDTGSRKTEKHLVALEYSKKRPGSSETTGMLENPTSKRRRMIQASRMMMKKKTGCRSAHRSSKEGRRADKPGGAVKTSSSTIAGNTDGVHCSYITGAATK